MTAWGVLRPNDSGVILGCMALRSRVKSGGRHRRGSAAGVRREFEWLATWLALRGAEVPGYRSLWAAYLDYSRPVMAGGSAGLPGDVCSLVARGVPPSPEQVALLRRVGMPVCSSAQYAQLLDESPEWAVATFRRCAELLCERAAA